MKGDFFERNFLRFEKQMLLLATDDVSAETMVIRFFSYYMQCLRILFFSFFSYRSSRSNVEAGLRFVVGIPVL